MTTVAIKITLSLIMLSILSGCAYTPARPQQIYRSEHPCQVIDNGVPLPEVIAEMVYNEQPEYPRLASQAGLEGNVEIRALIGNDGSVLDAVLFKTSGTPSLDDAALRAAPKCLFKSARRNGQPVCMWVNYIVGFSLR